MGDMILALLKAAVTQLLTAGEYWAWNYPVIRDLQREHKRVQFQIKLVDFLKNSKSVLKAALR